MGAKNAYEKFEMTNLFHDFYKRCAMNANNHVAINDIIIYIQQIVF